MDHSIASESNKSVRLVTRLRGVFAIASIVAVVIAVLLFVAASSNIINFNNDRDVFFYNILLCWHAIIFGLVGRTPEHKINKIFSNLGILFGIIGFLLFLGFPYINLGS